jgi:hypothetical protein
MGRTKPPGTHKDMSGQHTASTNVSQGSSAHLTGGGGRGGGTGLAAAGGCGGCCWIAAAAAAAAAPAAVGVSDCGGGVAAPVAPAPPEDVEVVRARLAPFRVKDVALRGSSQIEQTVRAPRRLYRTPWRDAGGRRRVELHQPQASTRQSGGLGSGVPGCNTSHTRNTLRGGHGSVSVSAACGPKPGKGRKGAAEGRARGAAQRCSTVSCVRRHLRRRRPPRQRRRRRAGSCSAAPPPRSLSASSHAPGEPKSCRVTTCGRTKPEQQRSKDPERAPFPRSGGLARD